MTYCMGMLLRDGLVMVSDTRTNAGFDNISTFRKMTLWENPGERVVAVMTAGNLAACQAVVNLLDEGIELDAMRRHSPGDDQPKVHTLLDVPTMFQAAQLVGAAVREVYRIDGQALEAHTSGFNVSLILGGQIRNRQLRMFHIYAAGNFIEATADTPYLQIGEHKYGKPILDRACAYDTDLTGAVKLALLSMDSTVRSNLSVGLPVDLLVYRRDAIEVALKRRIEPDDEYFRQLSQGWSSALRDAYNAMPDPDWMTGG